MMHSPRVLRGKLRLDRIRRPFPAISTVMGAACQKSAAETFEEEIELPTLSEHKEDGSSAPATARFDGNPDAVYLNCLHPLLIAPADLSDDKGLIGMAAGKEGSVSTM